MFKINGLLKNQSLKKPAKSHQRYSAFKGYFSIALISILIIFIFGSCAPFSLKTRPTPPPFSQNEIFNIFSKFREQKRWADTFFSSGRLEFKGSDIEGESDILIACSRDPFRLKIELTHSWGKPLLHILIHEKTFHILSFQDKQYSIGELGDYFKWSFFPVSLNQDQLWGIARGFPVLEDYKSAVSGKGNQITLLDNKGKNLQVIDLLPESDLPGKISFPQQKLQISFMEFQTKDDLYYASSIMAKDDTNDNVLILNLKQMVFNKSISEDFFVLEIPPDFKIIQIPGSKEK